MAKLGISGKRDLNERVQRILDHFATSCRAASSTRDAREKADTMLSELLAALRPASVSEIAELAQAVEKRVKARPARRETTTKRPSMRPQTTRSSRAAEAEPASSIFRARDPFDITMPDELLDSVQRDLFSEPKREDEAPPASAFRARDVPPATTRVRSGARSSRPAAPSPAGAAEPQAADAKQPAVSLREGEQLVRASGSGVVIRRIRSA